MNRKEIEEKLIVEIVDLLELDELKADDLFEQVGITSIDQFEIGFLIEKLFQKKLAVDDLKATKTVNQLVELILA